MYKGKVVAYWVNFAA